MGLRRQSNQWKVMAWMGGAHAWSGEDGLGGVGEWRGRVEHKTIIIILCFLCKQQKVHERRLSTVHVLSCSPPKTWHCPGQMSTFVLLISSSVSL